MRLILRCLLATLMLLVLGIPVAVWFAFADAPLLKPGPEISHTDVERARRVLERNDPRKLPPGALRHLALSQAELDLLLNQAARRLPDAAARVVLHDAGAALQASVRIPHSPIGAWINIDAALQQSEGLPRFDHLRVGKVPIPGWLADMVLEQALKRLNTRASGQLAADMVQGVRFSPTQLQVQYQWRDDFAARARDVLVPPEAAQRLRAYNQRIAATVGATPSAQGVSLARLLSPVFALAHERSANGDAALENRAAIIALAFYANGRGLAALTPAARDWPSPAARTVTLAGRDDFPKHFLISAALAAESGGALADAIGLYKEVDDSRGGSGFSFNDIAADRAGTRFGQLAVQAPARLQGAIAGGVAEADFMPDVGDLPEFMPEAEFIRRFGGIGAPAYAKMMATIEARVAALPLFR